MEETFWGSDSLCSSCGRQKSKHHLCCLIFAGQILLSWAVPAATHLLEDKHPVVSWHSEPRAGLHFCLEVSVLEAQLPLQLGTLSCMHLYCCATGNSDASLPLLVHFFISQDWSSELPWFLQALCSVCGTNLFRITNLMFDNCS